MNYGPADYILCFPSAQEAEQFGLANGFARTMKDGTVRATMATHEYALAVIGEHFPPAPAPAEGAAESPPAPAGDGKHWVLFRDLKGLDIPAGAADYIVWASWFTELAPDPEDVTKAIEVPVPRPTGPAVPNRWWA